MTIEEKIEGKIESLQKIHTSKLDELVITNNLLIDIAKNYISNPIEQNLDFLIEETNKVKSIRREVNKITEKILLLQILLIEGE
jgi:hypothetical protein